MDLRGSSETISKQRRHAKVIPAESKGFGPAIFAARKGLPATGGRHLVVTTAVVFMQTVIRYR